MPTQRANAMADGSGWAGISHLTSMSRGQTNFFPYFISLLVFSTGYLWPVQDPNVVFNCFAFLPRLSHFFFVFTCLRPPHARPTQNLLVFAWSTQLGARLLTKICWLQSLTGLLILLSRCHCGDQPHTSTSSRTSRCITSLHPSRLTHHHGIDLR